MTNTSEYETDPLLAMEAQTANSGDRGTVVSLVVAGTTWIGYLTDARDFLETGAREIDKLAEMAGGYPDQQEKHVARAERMRGLALSDEASEGEGKYIHLANVRKVEAGQVAYPVLRFATASVDAWTYGPIKAEDD